MTPARLQARGLCWGIRCAERVGVGRAGLVSPRALGEVSWAQEPLGCWESTWSEDSRRLAGALEWPCGQLAGGPVSIWKDQSVGKQGRHSWGQ